MTEPIAKVMTPSSLLGKDFKTVFQRHLLNSAYRYLIFGVALLTFLIYGLWSARVSWLFGDEPHYVAVSQSIVKYGTIDTTQVYQNKDYWSYHGDNLTPDSNAKSMRGQFSVHTYLLPLLLSPAIFLGEKLGSVQVFVASELAIISALGMLLVFEFNREIFQIDFEAMLTTLIFTISLPFVLYSHLVFPDLVTGWFLLLAVYLVFTRRLQGNSVYVVALLLALLPWLHIKNTSLSVLMILYILLTLWKRYHNIKEVVFSRTLWITGLPSALSLLGYLSLNYYLFGKFSPTGSYGENEATLFSGNPFIGLLGNFFDQGHGLLLAMPISAMLLVGVYYLWKFNRSLLLTLAFLLLPFYTLNMTFQDWFGGYSPPTRYLMPLLPVTSVWLTAIFVRIRSLISWVLAVLLFMVGGLETVLLPLAKSYMFVGNTPNDLMNSLGPKFAVVTRFWPSYFFISAKTWLGTLGLAVFMVFIFTLVLVAETRVSLPGEAVSVSREIA